MKLKFQYIHTYNSVPTHTRYGWLMILSINSKHVLWVPGGSQQALNFNEKKLLTYVSRQPGRLAKKGAKTKVVLLVPNWKIHILLYYYMFYVDNITGKYIKTIAGRKP